MSNNGLTPNALRQLHAASVAKSDTFETQGVSRQAALDHLNNTDEGAMYWFRVGQGFDSGTPSPIITERAANQLMSGLELPRMEIMGTHEALLKFVAEDSSPSSFSP